MAFAALKKWEEAEEFFEICVSSPAQVPAAIQLEAFKKLTLVQLISRGTVGSSASATRPRLTTCDKDCSGAKIHKQFSKSFTEDVTVWVIREGVSSADCNVEENR